MDQVYGKGAALGAATIGVARFVRNDSWMTAIAP